MPVTNPEAIRFVNEAIRPIAEDMRDLKIRIDAAIVSYFLIDGEFATDADTIEDGRDAEGVSRLVSSDVKNLVTQMQAYQTQLNGGGVGDVVSKPTVRKVGRSL